MQPSDGSAPVVRWIAIETLQRGHQSQNVLVYQPVRAHNARDSGIDGLEGGVVATNASDTRASDSDVRASSEQLAQ